MPSDLGSIIRVTHDDVVLTPDVVQALDRLPGDGAWADDEVKVQVRNPEPLYRGGLLRRVTTGIGDLTVLTPRGASAIGTPASRLPSPMVQTSRAYVRLSLATLGWPEGGAARHLLAHDTSGRMTAAMTGEGPALVVGKLPAGYSVSALRGIRARLKSTVLRQDFLIISLTPGSQRGRQFAQRNTSWFRQVHVVPDLGPNRPRQAVWDEAQVGTPYRGRPLDDPLDEALAYLELERGGHSYGQLWDEIVHLPHEGRLTAFEAALACDGVISEQQLGRIYGLTRHDVGSTPWVDAVVRPLHSRPAFQVATRFYLREKRHRNLQWSTLDHAASVAEMRVQRDVPPDPERWQSGSVLGRADDNRPDAIYIGEWGPEAIEYDRGTYTMRIVQNKLSSWRNQGYDDIYWGVPSLHRRARLAQAFEIIVLHTHWF